MTEKGGYDVSTESLVRQAAFAKIYEQRGVDRSKGIGELLPGIFQGPVRKPQEPRPYMPVPPCQTPNGPARGANGEIITEAQFKVITEVFNKLIDKIYEQREIIDRLTGR